MLNYQRVICFISIFLVYDQKTTFFGSPGLPDRNATDQLLTIVTDDHPTRVDPIDQDLHKTVHSMVQTPAELAYPLANVYITVENPPIL